MINKIVENGFCIGCGLCSSVLGNDKCRMKLFDNGFYYPVVLDEKVNDKIVANFCPGITVHDNRKHGVWGNVVDVEEAWSTDKELRYKAASGGVSSAIALYMLGNGLVDAVLQVGREKDSALYNELKVSRNQEEICNNAQSRYAPALTLSNLKQILDSGNEKYAFIGKPCDIAGIKNFMETFSKYKERILYFISIFCAGMPSYNASRMTWKQSGRSDEPIFLKYRGEGWPGNFKAVWKDGQKYEISYNDSWGKVLGRALGFRCKICPDGIGMLADIAIGDSWNTKNGYPDFMEADGRNFCFIRSKKGKKLFDAAVRSGYIEAHELDIKKVKEMQAYQYNRRHIVGWRIMAANVASAGLLDFKGLGLIKLALKTNIKQGLKESLGTFKRVIKSKRQMRRILNSEQEHG